MVHQHFTLVPALTVAENIALGGRGLFDRAKARRTVQDIGVKTGLVLDPALVQLAGRPTKPFQGWRYLQPDAAPPDLALSPRALGEDDLPPALRRELRMLCLL